MARMASHSEGSFNEADANRLLSDRLESGHKIKTFFKENDKTPNHDGTFELVDKDRLPLKQFIVQIKKSDSIVPGKDGCYPYDLETGFLYYVKERVTESPAVYFVVDIDNGRIFYLYLSDERLMSLDFEDKQTVRYRFSNDDILDDVDAFYDQMLKISNERNKYFINKTPQMIAELQDAADYINTLLNGELRSIKDAVFPSLWRFGVGHTASKETKYSISSPNHPDRTIQGSAEANYYGLYPQVKGSVTPEIGEFSKDSIFQSIDFTQQTKPMDYVHSVVLSILEQYCLNPPLSILPTLVLEEMAYKEMNTIHKYVSRDKHLSVNQAFVDYIAMLLYFDFLLRGKALSPDDEKRKIIIANVIKQGHPHCISLENPFMWGDLSSFVASIKDDPDITYNDEIIKFISYRDIRYFDVLNELRLRGVVEFSITHLVDVEDNPSVFFKKYYGELLPLYFDVYNKVFDSDKYFYSRDVHYSVIGEAMLYRVNKAKRGVLELSYDESIDRDYLELKESGSNMIAKGFASIGKWNVGLRGKTIYYDGIRCLLYQGLCESLGYGRKSLSLYDAFPTFA